MTIGASRRIVTRTFLSLIFVGIVTSAVAQQPKNMIEASLWCMVGSNDALLPESIIVGCSKLLESAGKGRTEESKDRELIFIQRGRAYAAKKDFDRALSDFNEAVRLKSEIPESFQTRGTCFLTIGRYQKAIKDFDIAMKLFQKPVSDSLVDYNKGRQAQVLYLRSQAKSRSGDKKGANADIAALDAMVRDRQEFASSVQKKLSNTFNW